MLIGRSRVACLICVKCPPLLSKGKKNKKIKEENLLAVPFLFKSLMEIVK